jgi:DNA processing protein
MLLFFCFYLINKAFAKCETLVLYYKGDIQNTKKHHGISIIGTREPTNEGVAAGLFYGENFAKLGYNIVSGLAIGCDTAGHQGALNVSGITTAILAHGLNTIYPKQNKLLSDKILDNGGLLLSEYPIGTYPMRQYFVERDRLQAGFSYATIVIQTGIKGGTMHAVRATLENKKPLLVVKFQNNSLKLHPKVEGNYKLIKEGAFELREVDKALGCLKSFYGKSHEDISKNIKEQPLDMVFQSKINFD